jgi:dTDP-4-amino-4,6-dideoxygalactose transaminase
MQSRRRTRLEFQPPALGEEEVEAVAETLRSGWIGPGPKEELLERRVAETLGVRNVVAVSSCTIALELSLLALDVGPGDEVITSPFTWPATANAIAHTGARPVFCDVRDDDLTLDAAAAAELVTDRTRAIVPVHLAGQPADLDAIAELGLPIVEDAAHAFGAASRGRPIGSVGDAACFSLYVTKHVAAAEGGLVVTERDDLADRVRGMRRIGRDATGRYDQVGPALKASIPDVLSSIALVQLDKLRRHDEARERQFGLYDAGLADLPGIEPLPRDERDDHGRHLYIVRIDAELAGGTRDEYQQALVEDLIATSVHFLPVHRLSWFSERYPTASLPVAERAGQEVLSLPLSPVHSDDDIRDVVEALRVLHARLAP